jgi:hypothetical protein
VCYGLDRLFGKFLNVARVSRALRAASPYIRRMCGRVIQARGPLHYAIVDGLDVRDSRLSNYPRRFNGCPSQEMLVIRQNHKTGERSRWRCGRSPNE